MTTNAGTGDHTVNISESTAGSTTASNAMKPVDKKWKMKAKLPFIRSEDVPDFGDFEITNLSCGCSCEDCKSTYKAFWAKKLACEDLEKRLQSECLAMKSVIHQVAEMESLHKAAIKELKNELALEKSKTAVIQQSLEAERQLRIEDIYKAQQQVDGVKEVYEENSKLQAIIESLNEKNRFLNNENKSFKTMSVDSTRVNERLLQQIRKYELEIQHLESSNDSLRVALYDSNVSVGLSQLQRSQSQQGLGMVDYSSSFLPSIGHQQQQLQQKAKSIRRTAIVAGGASIGNSSGAGARTALGHGLGGQQASGVLSLTAISRERMATYR